MLSLAIATTATVPITNDPSDPAFWAEASDDSVAVAADGAARVVDVAEASTPVGAQPTHQQRVRAPICPLGNNSLGTLTPCPGDPVEPLPECGDAATLPPLWERIMPDAVVTHWRLVGPAVCATPADVTPAMVLSAFQRLPLTPSPLVVQPDRGWVLVNKPTVVHADGGPQVLTTTVLGTAVTITATPTSFTWDFGDGATLATTDPGQPWPAGHLGHTYTRLGTFDLGLTTTWSATYTLAGNTTVRDVPGTATTSSASPLEVRERRAHLVGGTCDQDPAAPGC